jgi:hypothetical protein
MEEGGKTAKFTVRKLYTLTLVSWAGTGETGKLVLLR